MSHFLLIDSTTSSLLALKVNQNVVATEGKELKVISEEAKTKVTDDTIIIINAEAKIKGEALQDSKAIELIYWFQCKYNLKNPIVVFSVFSLNHQLRRNPNHFVLVSPGCYFYEEIPVLNDSYKPKPLSAFDDLKPFLKPKIDEILGTFRHRYANYSGMALMLEAAGIKPEDFETLQKNERFSTFVNSLDYAILTTYFGRNSNPSTLELKGKKRILLVDDMAEEGWLPILGKIIYEDAKSKKLDFVKVKTNANGWDESLTQEELEVKIKSHTPHLILLDLRLGDEQGSKPIQELGGYKLLTFLKNDPIYKGVPVIMFTATTKADTVKTLLQAGANAVWTKPGIDEGLSQKDIVERYEQLVTLIDATFNEFENLDLGLDENSKVVISFEEVRTHFYKKLDWIRYRIELSQNPIVTNFDDYTDIIVDTNFFISGDISQSRLNFEKTFINIFSLAHIFKDRRTEHCFEVNSTTIVSKKFPKIVLLNSILDEILSFAKTYKGEKPNVWKRSLLAFTVLRTLFDKKLLRTELVYLNGNKPSTALSTPGDNTIPALSLNVSQSSTIDADDLIVIEVKHIVKGEEFEIKNNVKLKFTTSDPKVLVLTNEKDKAGKIPYKVKATISDPSKFDIFNIEQFNTEMDIILSKL